MFSHSSWMYFVQPNSGPLFQLEKTPYEKYCKIPKISPGAYIFLEGPYIRRGLCTEGNLCFQIDWASFSGKEIYHCCFVLLCIWGQIPSTRFFCFTILGGLYMEGLIFGILRYVITEISRSCEASAVRIKGKHVNKKIKLNRKQMCKENKNSHLEVWTYIMITSSRLKIISGEPSDTMTGQIHFSSVTYRFWPVKC